MTVLGGSSVGISKFELKTFHLDKVEERFESLRTLLK